MTAVVEGGSDGQGAVVKVVDLHKVYDPSPIWMRFLLRTAVRSPVTALDGLSLSLGRGQVMAVVGPNGAGKSTLFRILTGLTTATSGSVEVCGVDVARDPVQVRRLVGFQPTEDQTLYLRLSCNENLRFHGRLHGLRGRVLERRIQDTLEMVGLGGVGERVGFALSAGMRARLNLARALLHRPALLILDEPTGAVDPVGSHELLQVIQTAAREASTAVLLSSHRLEEIEALDDQVALLNKGKLVYQGDLGQLRRRWQRPTYELSFASWGQLQRAISVLTASGLPLEVARTDGRELTVSFDGPLGEVLSQLNGQLTGLASVRPSTISLRDLLIRLVDSPHRLTDHAEALEEAR